MFSTNSQKFPKTFCGRRNRNLYIFIFEIFAHRLDITLDLFVWRERSLWIKIYVSVRKCLTLTRLSINLYLDYERLLYPFLLTCFLKWALFTEFPLTSKMIYRAQLTNIILFYWRSLYRIIFLLKNKVKTRKDIIFLLLFFFQKPFT